MELLQNFSFLTFCLTTEREHTIFNMTYCHQDVSGFRKSIEVGLCNPNISPQKVGKSLTMLGLLNERPSFVDFISDISTRFKVKH